MTTYSRPGRPQVHGTVDPDTQRPERFADRIDPALLEEFNAGVRRARAGVPLPEPCRWCPKAKSGRCKHHRAPDGGDAA